MGRAARNALGVESGGQSSDFDFRQEAIHFLDRRLFDPVRGIVAADTSTDGEGANRSGERHASGVSANGWIE